MEEHKSPEGEVLNLGDVFSQTAEREKTFQVVLL